ncbi:aminotransferase-like domain-containing protein [Dactylosporangium darangshiense]|uniref:PLP-dependent aminotransferase family protein n=1 Tax=Dactylosporangium darangshiense TaxID=579108 RepID=A0ABP8DPI6_9ACTN
MNVASRLGAWRSAGGSLAQSLAAAVQHAVLDGQIPVGSPLPSERALARDMDVSRGTIVAALALLRDAGWIRTRHGSGSVVRLPPRLTTRTAPWSLDHGGGEVELDLTQAVTAAPHRAYLAAARRAVDRCATLLLDAGTANAGLPQLRELLAERYTRQGLATHPGQILITSGATAALTLLADHLCDRRRPILVESPTYPGALTVLRRRGTRLISIPVSEGSWGQAPELIGSSRASLAYLTPDFHNPTGALMPDDVRRQVSACADRHDVTVVVDETMRDLDLRTPPVDIPHLAGPRVITIGSTSKVIWSGLRVGWIRASAALVRELLLHPLQARLSPPPLEQLIAHDLLGDLDGLVSERRAQLRHQRDHLVGLLGDHGGWTYTVPSGGLTVWLQLHNTTAVAVAARARRRGLALTPGPQFSADRTLTNYLRVPFTASPEILTRAVDLLVSPPI